MGYLHTYIKRLKEKGYIDYVLLKEQGNKRILRCLLKDKIKAIKENNNSSQRSIKKPIQESLKHNKDFNKEINEREKSSLPNFERLKESNSVEFNQILKNYKIKSTEIRFIKNKFNKKPGSQNIIDFENFCANWQRNNKDKKMTNQPASTTSHLFNR